MIVEYLTQRISQRKTDNVFIEKAVRGGCIQERNFKEKCNGLKLLSVSYRERIRYCLVACIHMALNSNFCSLPFVAFRSLNPLKQKGFDFDKIYSGLPVSETKLRGLSSSCGPQLILMTTFFQIVEKCLHKFHETAWLRALEFSMTQYTMFRFCSLGFLVRFTSFSRLTRKT